MRTLIIGKKAPVWTSKKIKKATKAWFKYLSKMEKSKSILIIGGAGYVGSDLVPFLLQKGFKITVYDLMIYGENVLEKHKDLKIIKGDIRNEILQ